MKSTHPLTALLGMAFLGGLCGSALFYAFMGTSSVTASAPEVQSVVRAKRVEIVDPEGKLRTSLGITEEGTGLIVYDPDGKVVLLLGISPTDTRGLVVFDPEKALRILLGISVDGLAFARLRSAQSQSHITLVTSADTEPKIEIKNRQDQVVWSAP
ncbi:MAG: hypothetical protein OEU26_29720 [Candidatus Tectomicrobia bacterium]|nr:hypothetical protein [Candidatus Tectomicrobia bacterium]